MCKVLVHPPLTRILPTRIVIIDDNRFMTDIIQNSSESLSLYLSLAFECWQQKFFDNDSGKQDPLNRDSIKMSDAL